MSYIREIQISEFINNIQNFTHFKSFRQTLELVSHKSELFNYYNLLILDIYIIEDPSKIFDRHINIHCKYLPTIRNILIVFWSLIDEIDKQNDANNEIKNIWNEIISAVNTVIKYISYIYQNPNYVKINTIFLPLIIHFSTTEWKFS